MRKFVVTLVFGSVVLGLGQVSCAPDKAGKVSVPDDFEVTMPQLESNGKSLSLYGVSSLSTTFSTEDIVVFPSLKNRKWSEEPIQISASSACKSKITAKMMDVSFQNVASIRLRDILPTEALFQPAGSAPFICSVDFLVKNHLGSTHSIRNLSFNVTAPAKELGLSMRDQEGKVVDDSSQTLARIQETKSELLKVEGLARRSAKPERQSVQLLCEGFWARIDQENFEAKGMTALAQVKPLAYEGIPLQDRTIDPVQTCRVLSEDKSENRTVSASTYFQLEFGPPPLQVTTHFELDGYNFSALDRVKVLEIKIKNPYPIAIPAALALDKSDAFRVQPVLADPMGNLSALEIRKVRLNFELQGAKQGDDNDFLKFTVEPNQTVTVIGTMNMNFYCYRSGQSAHRPDGMSILWGFNYFVDPLAFAVLQTPDNRLGANDIFIIGLTQKQSDVLKPAVAGSSVPYWAPWTKDAGWDSPVKLQKADPLNSSLPAPGRTQTDSCKWR